jgi:hypothetical protein
VSKLLAFAFLGESKCNLCVGVSETLTTAATATTTTAAAAATTATKITTTTTTTKGLQKVCTYVQCKNLASKLY